MKENPLKDSAVPPELTKLFSSILGPLGACRVGRLAAEPDHIEDRVNMLLKNFDEFPEWKMPFQTLVKSMRGKSDASTLEEQIRFFTTKHTRYWLMVNKINRVLKVKELELDLTTGRLPARAHDLLKYAHQAREAFGEESRYKDVVFACGIIFDFFFFLQKSTYLDLNQIKLDDFINQSYVKATEQGKRIISLGKYKKKLDLEKLTPATAFLRQLAQVTLVFLKPTEAMEFYKKLETEKPSEPLKLAMELKQFGIHTGMIATYLASIFSVFGPLGEAMSTLGYPYIGWLPGREDTHDLIGMGQLGINITERNLKADRFGSVGKPFVEIPELRYLDFEITSEVKNEAKI